MEVLTARADTRLSHMALGAPGKKVALDMVKRIENYLEGVKKGGIRVTTWTRKNTKRRKRKGRRESLVTS